MEKKAVGDVRDEEIYTGITNVQDESEEQFNCDGIGVLAFESEPMEAFRRLANRDSPL